MRKIIVLSMVSLDGVIQGPGSPEEDTEHGFSHGGWVAPYDDEAYDAAVQDELKPADYLLGRKTFEIWENYWPNHSEFWPGINQGMKYVISKSRKESNWKNSTFIESIEDIKKVKASKGSDLQVWGSSELVQLLLKYDLVDELRLKIHPVILGKGKKLFNNGINPLAFKLASNTITTKGVILANYKRKGQVKTGTIGA